MRYAVDTYDPNLDDWVPSGSVLLPPRAPHHEVEGALASLNIYAPRGADRLVWFCYGGHIEDSNGRAIVLLTEVVK